MISRSASIYVAGHTGLIGSACLRELEKAGFRNILTRPRHDLDLREQGPVRDFFRKEKPEIVILGAGRVGGILENTRHGFELMRDNLLIQTNVFLAAEEIGVRKVVYFASSCMYPKSCSQPMKEEDLLTGKPEETSLPYAASKLAGLHMGLAYNRQNQKTIFLPLIPNSTYGFNDDFDPKTAHVLTSLIARFHDAKTEGQDAVVLWGTGSPRREFIYSDDVASAVLFLLDMDPDVELPVNVGIGEDWSIKDLAHMIREIVGYRGGILWDTAKPDGAPRKLLDSSRILKAGWKAKTSLEEGIRKTYDWYISQLKESK